MKWFVQSIHLHRPNCIFIVAKTNSQTQIIPTSVNCWWYCKFIFWFYNTVLVHCLFWSVSRFFARQNWRNRHGLQTTVRCCEKQFRLRVSDLNNAQQLIAIFWLIGFWNLALCGSKIQAQAVTLVSALCCWPGEKTQIGKTFTKSAAWCRCEPVQLNYVQTKHWCFFLQVILRC